MMRFESKEEYLEALRGAGDEVTLARIIIFLFKEFGITELIVPRAALNDPQFQYVLREAYGTDGVRVYTELAEFVR